MKSVIWDNRSATTQRVVLLVTALALLAALFALTGWAHILLPAVKGEGKGGLASQGQPARARA